MVTVSLSILKRMKNPFGSKSKGKLSPRIELALTGRAGRAVVVVAGRGLLGGTTVRLVDRFLQDGGTSKFLLQNITK